MCAGYIWRPFLTVILLCAHTNLFNVQCRCPLEPIAWRIACRSNAPLHYRPRPGHWLPAIEPIFSLSVTQFSDFFTLVTLFLKAREQLNLIARGNNYSTTPSSPPQLRGPPASPPGPCPQTQAKCASQMRMSPYTALPSLDKDRGRLLSPYQRASSYDHRGSYADSVCCRSSPKVERAYLLRRSGDSRKISNLDSYFHR